MKLPAQIKGRNRIRDAAILSCYLPPKSMLPEDIGKKFNLTEQRIGQILKQNVALLKTSKDWEAVKDVEFINRALATKPETNKDPIDLILAKHKILEDNKPLVDLSTHYQQIIYVRQDTQDVNSPDLLQATRLPETN